MTDAEDIARIIAPEAFKDPVPAAWSARAIDKANAILAGSRVVQALIAERDEARAERDRLRGLLREASKYVTEPFEDGDYAYRIDLYRRIDAALGGEAAPRDRGKMVKPKPGAPAGGYGGDTP